MNENYEQFESEQEVTEEVLQETAPLAEEPVVEEPVAEVAEEAAMPSMTPIRKKTPWTVFAGIAAAAAVLVGIVAGAVANTPTNLIRSGIKNTVKSINKMEISQYTNKVMNGGSTEILVDAGALTERFLGEAINGTASIKVYTDAEAAQAAIAADVKMDGTSLVDGALIVTEKELVLSSDALLGDNAYGINIEKLAENFEDSIFGPDGAYSLGIEPEMIENLMNSTKESEKLMTDAEKVVGDMTKALMKSINKHAEIEKETKKISFNGKDTKTTAVEIKLDGDAVEDIAKDMLDYLENDRKFKAFLTDALEYAAKVSDEDIDVDDMLDEFYDALDEVEVKEISEMMEDVEVSVTFYITKSGRRLVGMDVAAKVDDEKATISIKAGPSFDKLSEISVAVNYGSTKAEVAYLVTERSNKLYASELKVKMGKETLFTGKFEWDKKAGEYELELPIEGQEIKVEGELSYDGKTATFGIGEVSMGEEAMDLTGISLIMKAEDAMPSVPNYKDVLTMTESDAEAFISDVQKAVQGLAEDVMKDFDVPMY